MLRMIQMLFGGLNDSCSGWLGSPMPGVPSDQSGTTDDLTRTSTISFSLDLRHERNRLDPYIRATQYGRAPDPLAGRRPEETPGGADGPDRVIRRGDK
jgi:hypothetical protein